MSLPLDLTIVFFLIVWILSICTLLGWYIFPSNGCMEVLLCVANRNGEEGSLNQAFYVSNYRGGSRGGCRGCAPPPPELGVGQGGTLTNFLSNIMQIALSQHRKQLIT